MSAVLRARPMADSRLLSRSPRTASAWSISLKASLGYPACGMPNAWQILQAGAIEQFVVAPAGKLRTGWHGAFGTVSTSGARVTSSQTGQPRKLTARSDSKVSRAASQTVGVHRSLHILSDEAPRPNPGLFPFANRVGARGPQRANNVCVNPCSREFWLSLGLPTPIR